jgi:hypothetical protein
MSSAVMGRKAPCGARWVSPSRGGAIPMVFMLGDVHISMRLRSKRSVKPSPRWRQLRPRTLHGGLTNAPWPQGRLRGQAHGDGWWCHTGGLARLNRWGILPRERLTSEMRQSGPASGGPQIAGARRI